MDGRTTTVYPPQTKFAGEGYNYLHKNSEYDQDIPQSQTAGKHMAS